MIPIKSLATFRKEDDMEIKDKRIDEGKAFDWGRTSDHYAALAVLKRKD